MEPRILLTSLSLSSKSLAISFVLTSYAPYSVSSNLLTCLRSLTSCAYFFFNPVICMFLSTTRQNAHTLEEIKEHPTILLLHTAC